MTDKLFIRVANGALWMILFKVVEKFLGLISTLILVRLLEPADFGVMAMAVSAIAIAELFAAFGFDTALIQRNDASAGHYNAAWTLGIIVTGVVSACLFFTAPLVASYYAEPSVKPVLQALAFSPIIVGLQNVGIVEFRKQLQFRREFRFQLAKKVVGFLVTLPLAFLLGTYWALVWGTLASRVFGTVLSYFVHSFRPRLSTTHIKDLLGFSQWLFLSNLLNLVHSRAPTLILGRQLDARHVGIFEVSNELASMPTTEFGAPINRALLPGFSRSTVEERPRLYRNVISTLSLVSCPAAIGILSLSYLIVPVILGQKWADAEPVIQILAINGVFAILQASMRTMLIAAGLPKLVFKANVVGALLLVPLLLWSIANYQMVGAAIALLISSVFTLPIFLYLTKKHLNIEISTFLIALIRPFSASLMMLAFIWSVLPSEIASNTVGTNAILLISGIALGVASYTVVLLLLWHLAGRPDGGERIVIERARQELNSRFRRGGPNSKK